MINLLPKTDENGRQTGGASFLRPGGSNSELGAQTAGSTNMGYVDSRSLGSGGSGQQPFSPMQSAQFNNTLAASASDPLRSEATAAFVAANTKTASKPDLESSGPGPATAPASPPNGVQRNDTYPVGMAHPAANGGLDDESAEA
jgi:hypothetical protein